MRALAIAFLLPLAAVAVPRVLSHEGRLLRADGVPERGGVTLVFKLYETETGGAAAWSENQAVTLSGDGFYAVHLGSNVALPAFDGRPYWLGITVQGEQEMSPRARLTSAPYALVAEDANRLGGDASSEILRRTSTLDASRLAGNVPAAATNLALLQGGMLPDALLSARVPLLDTSTNLIPAMYLPSSVTGTVSDSTDLAVGQCLTVAHNFNTRAVFYQAWMTDAGAWIPMAAAARDGLTNIALARPTGASSSYPGYSPAAAVDGVEGCGTNAAWYTNGPTGWWQVDLGSVTLINRVRVHGNNYPAQCNQAFTSYEVQVSTDGTAFTIKVADGVCVPDGTCTGFQDHVFMPVAARYVRLNGISGPNPAANGFSEVQVFGATYPVTTPDVDHIRLCNYTGLTRTFNLVVGH